MGDSIKKGDEVHILDYPFGKPITSRGKVVGVLDGDYYNVLMESGCHEGQIKKYKYWKLSLTRDTEDGTLV